MPEPGWVCRGWIRIAPYAATATLLLGCHAGSAPTARSSTQPVITRARPSNPAFHRISPLLDFETATDVLFVAADPGPLRLDTAHARAGRSAALLPKGTTRLSIKLSALVSGRDFPGTWTLAGLHLFTTHPTDCTLSVVTPAAPTPLCTRTLKLSPNHWTPAFLDLGPLTGPAAPRPDDLRLIVTFPTPLSAGVWCDDVLLADNARTLVDPSEGVDGHDGWTVRREGFHWLIDRPQRFRIILPAEEEAGGWTLDEANRIRARFHSAATAAGKAKSLTVYADGRSYWDAAYKPLSPLDAAPTFPVQHLHPASLRIPDDQGRLDRNTPGDANHDGYNESTGAYTLVAAGRRLNLTLVPRPDAPLTRPVFDIRNLPPGDVRATLEGTPAPDTLRLPDGRVLLIAPVFVQRPATLDIRVH